MMRWFLPIFMICLVTLTSCQHNKNKPHNLANTDADTTVEETNVSFTEEPIPSHSSIEQPTHIKYRVFSSIVGWAAQIPSWIKVMKAVYVIVTFLAGWSLVT